MAIKLIGDAEPNPRHNEWRFRVLRTQPRSKVSEFFDVPLSHEIVEQIYRKTIGEVPGTGLERRNLSVNWARLEPHFIAAIERKIGPG